MDYKFINETIPTLNRINTYAVPYSDVVSHTPVINKLQFEDVLWVEMLNIRSHDVTVESISDYDTGEEIELTEEAYFRNMKSRWIRLSVDVLNSEVGMHIYKIALKDERSTDTVNLYFAYTIQDDNLEKPYVYMKRG